VTVSSLSVVPEATASGTAPYAETSRTFSDVELALRLQWMTRSADIRQQAIARAARADYLAWLSHVKVASACTRPVRLAGTIATIEAATGRILSETSTAGMPDGVIYKPCRFALGDRRLSAALCRPVLAGLRSRLTRIRRTRPCHADHLLPERRATQGGDPSRLSGLCR
jgi:hypothetical protein